MMWLRNNFLSFAFLLLMLSGTLGGVYIGIHLFGDKELFNIAPEAPVTPTVEVEAPPFIWHLKDVDWTDADVHIDEALRMLEQLDRELHETAAPEARAAYMNARVGLLYHIHIYSDRIKFKESDAAE